eukprot:7537883-Karenia_brevis.AAC.1
MSTWWEANECIDALNMLYGSTYPRTDPGPSQNISPAHASIHSHILRSIAGRRPTHVQRPRACARRVLGSLTEYSGEVSSVRPYSPDLVSLPDGSRNTVHISSVLRPETWEAVQ